jgi:nitroreductase
MDAIDAILRRTSIRRFRPDPVPRGVIERLLDAAVRAPNHKLTEPWRFAVLSGAARDAYAEIRGRHRLGRFADPDSEEARAAARKVRDEALQTPVFIVVMMVLSPDEVVREEDYASVMMATANLMVAAESLGLGTYLRTGGIMREAAVAALAGLGDAQRIVGIVSLGYPADTEPPRRRRPASEVTIWRE